MVSVVEPLGIVKLKTMLYENERVPSPEPGF